MNAASGYRKQNYTPDDVVYAVGIVIVLIILIWACLQ